MRRLLGLLVDLIILLSVANLSGASGYASATESQGALGEVKVLVNSQSIKQDLLTWTLADGQGLKRRVQQELDPLTQRVSRFEGYALLEVMDRAMQPLSMQQKASVDLIVFRDARGAEIAMPRWLPTKYAILLAYQRDRENIAADGPFYLIMPWTTQGRIRKEPLPLEKFFIRNLAAIELTNMKQYYGKDFFLQNRSDPMSIRGEKRFVQTCMPCHRMQDIPQVQKLSESVHTREALDQTHSKAQGFASLDDKEYRALVLYMDQLLKAEAAKKKSFF